MDREIAAPRIGETVEQQVTFPAGDIVLEGLLFLPAGSPGIGVVVCHPHPLYGGDMHNNVVSALVAGLQNAGIATLRFNFRGVGGSGGSHDDGNGEVDDVKAAVTCLLARSGVKTVAVAGYSFGSYVGLKAGADDPRVHGLVGVALPAARRDVSFIHGIAKPLRLISGDRDDVSPVPKLEALLGEGADPEALVVIPGADHFFWGVEDRVAAAAIAFLARRTD